MGGAALGCLREAVVEQCCRAGIGEGPFGGRFQGCRSARRRVCRAAAEQRAAGGILGYKTVVKVPRAIYVNVM